MILSETFNSYHQSMVVFIEIFLLFKSKLSNINIPFDSSLWNFRGKYNVPIYHLVLPFDVSRLSHFMCAMFSASKAKKPLSIHRATASQPALQTHILSLHRHISISHSFISSTFSSSATAIRLLPLSVIGRL